jgi:hypothetical protein
MAGGQQTTFFQLLATAIVGLIIAIGSPAPSRAADLGGDCCADLEERVAELEATTVRKGNRKVSVKLSGHVNKMLLFWDDGINDDVYVVDNSDSESSFKLSGFAHVSPSITAGFVIEVDVLSADSFSVDDRIDGAPNENRDGILVLDVASFHIKHERLGKITIGRNSPSTDDILTLDLSSNPVAGPDPGWIDSFHLVRPQGTLGCDGAACRTALNTDALSPERDTPNGDIIRYDSPSLHGFIFSTSWGEDDLADMTLRYKNQWNTLRFVAGIGYLWFTDETENLRGGGGTAVIPCPAPGLGQQTCVDQRQDFEALAGSTSLMHVPTGLYANLSAAHVTFNRSNSQSPLRASVFTAPVTGEAAEDADLWYVQAGVKRPLLAPALGDTTLYGEYQQWNDFGVRRDARSVTGLPVRTSEITDTSAGMWGLGIVQDIDVAAMKLYGSLRVWEHDLRAATAATAPEGEDIPLQDFYSLAVGGKISF